MLEVAEVVRTVVGEDGIEDDVKDVDELVVVVVRPLLHPFWQPFSTRQLSEAISKIPNHIAFI